MNNISKFNGVEYNTLHTLHNHLKSDDHPFIPTLVVWDEAHWGWDGKMGRNILAYCKKYSIPILALTATPRAGDTFHVAYQLSFFDLVNAGYLARPIVVGPVATGINWSPSLNGVRDFDAYSLKKLAHSRKRNSQVVEHFTSHSDRYGQTLVFACNIDHANLLVELFKHSGVSVAPIHSKVREEQRDQFLNEFRNGSVRVLINVEMLSPSRRASSWDTCCAIAAGRLR